MLIKSNLLKYDDFFGLFDEFDFKNEGFFKIDSDKDVTYYKYLPGVKKDNVEVVVDNDVLTVSVTGHILVKDYKAKFSMYVPKNVDIDNIDVSLEDGILSILFNKINKLKTLKIK